MADYTPLFPRSVCGGNYRLPLVHPDVEKVAARLASAYQTLSLKNEHRALALSLYRELVEADESIWNAIGDAWLEDNGLRPARAVRPMCDLKNRTLERVLNPSLETSVGCVFRIREWISRIEDAYGVTAFRALGEVISRDENGNLLPGDDI